MSCPHGNWGACDQCAEVDALYVRIGNLQEANESLLEVARTIAGLRGASMDRLFDTLDDLLDAADAAIAKATESQP